MQNSDIVLQINEDVQMKVEDGIEGVEDVVRLWFSNHPEQDVDGYLSRSQVQRLATFLNEWLAYYPEIKFTGNVQDTQDFEDIPF